jgi:hypothetical protein
VIIKLEDLEHYRDKTLDPTFDGVVLSYLTQVLYLNKMNRKNFTYTICKQRFINNRMVFYFKKDFYLLDEFNLKLTGTLENGLMGYWRIKYLDFHINQVVNVEGPSQLSFHELLGSFKVYFGGVLVCICVFILEKLSVKLKKLQKMLKLKLKVKKQK